MQYISLDETEGAFPLNRYRDLTDNDISTIAAFDSWSHIHAAFFALGKFPEGALNIFKNAQPTPPPELSHNFIIIVDRFMTAVKAGSINALPENNYFHVKPFEFLRWLNTSEGLPKCHPPLAQAVIHAYQTKVKREEDFNAILSGGLPLLTIPQEIDKVLWARAENIVEGDRPQRLANATGLEKSRLSVGADKRQVKIKTIYQMLWYAHNGCKCTIAELEPNILLSLSEQHPDNKLKERVREGLRSAQTELGENYNPGICPYHRHPA